MKAGIILNKNNRQLTDDCGNPIKLIVTTDKSLRIEFNTHNGSDVRKEQMTLDKKVVELLAQRLKELV